MFLGACKDRGGQILPNLTFESQKLHISGQIQVPLCQNLCFFELQISNFGSSCVFEPIKLIQNVMIGQIRPRHFNRLEKT